MSGILMGTNGDGSWSRWDAASGAALATYALPWGGASRAAAFGPDGALYMMASDTNVYRVDAPAAANL